MRTVKYTNRFKRDYRREKSGVLGKKLDTLLMTVVNLLAAAKPPPRRHFDHPLAGAWQDFRDGHIRPELVLIYSAAGWRTPSNSCGLARIVSSVCNMDREVLPQQTRLIALSL